MMDDRWISLEEVAKALGVSRPTATERLKSGKVPGLKDNHGTQRVDRKVFKEWLLTKDP